MSPSGCSSGLCTELRPPPRCPPRPVGWPRSQVGFSIATPFPRCPEPDHNYLKVPTAQSFVSHLGLGVLVPSLCGVWGAQPDSQCRSPSAQGPHKDRLLTGHVTCASNWSHFGAHHPSPSGSLHGLQSSGNAAAAVVPWTGQKVSSHMETPSITEETCTGPRALDGIKEGGQNGRQAWDVVSQYSSGREIIHIPFPKPATPGTLVWPSYAHARADPGLAHAHSDPGLTHASSDPGRQLLGTVWASHSLAVVLGRSHSLSLSLFNCEVG